MVNLRMADNPTGIASMRILLSAFFVLDTTAGYKSRLEEVPHTLFHAEKPDGERTPLSQHHFRFVLLRGNCASPLDQP